jgi:hypothetical protein
MASVCATFLMATSWWFLWASFVTFPLMVQDAAVVAAFYLLEKAFRDGKASTFWWSGAVAGMAVMTYVWGRFTPLLLLVWAAICFTRLENAGTLRKQRGWGMVPWLAGFLWILGPFFGWLFINQEFFSRVSNLSIFSHLSSIPNYFIPLKTLGYTALSPFATFSVDGRFLLPGRPLFDRLTSFLFFIGLVFALVDFRKRASWVLLLGVAAALPANALAVQGDNINPAYIHGPRLFGLLPFVFLGAALGLENLGCWVRSWGKAGKVFAGILLVLGLLACGFWNGIWFYYDFPAKSAWADLGYNQREFARIIRGYSGTHEVYADWVMDSSVVEFLDRDCLIHPINDGNPNFPDEHLEVPLKIVPDMDVAFLLVAEEKKSEGLKEKIMRAYPKAEFKVFKDPDGKDLVWGLFVHKFDLQ